MMAERPPARITPYEIGLPGREFATRVFADIQGEATSRGVDSTDPGAFLLLGEDLRDRDDAVGLRPRQRPEGNRVEDAERRGAGADAESERSQRGEREAGLAQEAAQRAAKVERET